MRGEGGGESMRGESGEWHGQRRGVCLKPMIDEDGKGGIYSAACLGIFVQLP